MIEEIARLFDQRAKTAEQQSKQATVIKHAALYNREATVWQTAAAILRDTDPEEKPALKIFDAAPDLLAACKALYATHKQGKGQCCLAADMAIDAIAKAEGRRQ